MIDIVDFTLPNLQIHEIANDFYDILGRQGSLLERQIQTELLIELETTDGREIIALGVQEKVIEQGPRGIDRWSFTRSQPAINLDHRLFLGADLLHLQGIENYRRGCRHVQIDNLKFLDIALDDLFDDLGSQPLILLRQLVFL